MKHPVSLSLLLGVASCAAAQAEPAKQEPVAHVYASPGGSPLKAYVFAPDDPGKGKRSAILLFHGGGWSMGSPDWTFTAARRFADAGLVAVAVEYRLSKGSVTPVDAVADACAAFGWIRQRADELHLTGRVAGYGVSAGGHLVASTATIGCPGGIDGPDALLLWSPALDVTHDRWFGTLLQGRAAATDLSPARHVGRSTPPTSIVHGEKDSLTPLTGVKTYCDALSEAGHKCDLHVYSGLGHLLTRNLANQESDYDPDPAARADGIEQQLRFLRSLGFVPGAALQPQAGDLLFTSARDGNSDIFLLPAGQTDWINLSKHEAGDNWPAWSPDGTRIVFQSNRTGKLDVWTMKADGSEQVQLTDHPEPDYLPSWSPDGKTILFTSWRKEDGDAERAPHIYAMDADGSNERRLVKASLNTSAGATWSGDGKLIVYERKGEKGADIYVADADGSNERRLTHDQDKNVYNGSPTLSPDGKSIAFSSDDEKTASLVVMNADGTGRRTVRAEGMNWYPRWSPDGRWLVYTAPAATGEKDNIDIFAVPLEEGAKPVLLVGSPKRESEGSWRPK